MTGQPSPYRCETCKYRPDRGLIHTNCPISSIMLPENWDVPTDVWMEIVSASGGKCHSAFSTPQEGAAPEPDYSRHNPRIELRKVCEQEAHDAAIAQAAREEAREEVPGKILFKRVFKMPRQFPSIKRRVIAFKDFETDGDESWNTISNSPTLEDGDVILILRQPTQKKEVPE